MRGYACFHDYTKISKRKLEIQTPAANQVRSLERFLKQIGTEGYAVGNKHTIADTHVLTHLTFMGSGFWDGIPADFSNSFARITLVRR